MAKPKKLPQIKPPDPGQIMIAGVKLVSVGDGQIRAAQQPMRSNARSTSGFGTRCANS